MNRTVLLVVLLLVVIVGGGLAYIFLQRPPTDNAEATDGAPTESARIEETDAPTATPIPMVPVVIAVQDIPRGTVIGPDRVGVISFPADTAPRGAFTDVSAVVGLIAATDIVTEEIILARKLVEDLNALGNVGSDAAAVLSPERVAVAVPIDEITSVAYGLRPGDRIDVIVSMLFVDVDEDFQTILPNDVRILIPASDEFGNIVLTWSEVAYGDLTSDSFYIPVLAAASNPDAPDDAISGTAALQFSMIDEPNPLDGRRQRPRLVTQRTVTNAQVIWVGEFPDDGRIFAPAPTPTELASPTPETESSSGADGTAPANTPVPPRPNLITLAVTPQDAVVLAWISEAGLPMTFAMRSARAQGLPDTSPVTMAYIMQAYNITVPDKFSYALEPAIRGVRGITLLDTGQQREAVVAEDNTEGDTSDPNASGAEATPSGN
jgi:Flp pilus assembly protein CpaB